MSSSRAENCLLLMEAHQDERGSTEAEHLCRVGHNLRPHCIFLLQTSLQQSSCLHHTRSERNSTNDLIFHVLFTVLLVHDDLDQHHFELGLLVDEYPVATRLP